MMVPELQTGRLWLLPCRSSDFKDLHTLWSEPEVRHWFWDDRLITEQEALDAIKASQNTFLQSGVGIWSVFLCDAYVFIGTVGLLQKSHPFYNPEINPQENDVPELMFAILPEYRRNGYATEATKAILAYAFEMAGINKVVSIVDEPNLASFRVHRRCGMSKTGSQVIDGQRIHFMSCRADDLIRDQEPLKNKKRET